MSDPATVGRLRRVIRAHPAIAWARQRSMQDDFEQLGLIEIAKILQTFNATVGTTPEQFVGVALRKRLFDCRRTLSSLAGDFTDRPDKGESEDGDGDDESTEALSTATSPGEDVLLERKQLAQELMHRVQALPSSQREVILLLLRDYTEAEIAKELGITVQAVNKAKKKAIETLRSAMSKQTH